MREILHVAIAIIWSVIVLDKIAAVLPIGNLQNHVFVFRIKMGDGGKLQATTLRKLMMLLKNFKITIFCLKIP